MNNELDLIEQTLSENIRSRSKWLKHWRRQPSWLICFQMNWSKQLIFFSPV